MGSCISKCRPKKKLKQDFSHVQDKLVISQQPISPLPPNIPIIPSSEKPVLRSPLPLDPSFSSFSCSNSSSQCTVAASSVSSSASSCSSSVLRTKDRYYYSNEIMWAYGGSNGLRKTFDSNGNKIYRQDSKTKESIQEPVVGPVPKKRARASSPTLVRQKSLRKERNQACSTQNRGQRSPSPSQRFSGDYARSNENSSRRHIVSKTSYGVKRDNLRPPNASPNRDRNSPARKKDSFTQQVSTKTDNSAMVTSSNSTGSRRGTTVNPLFKKETKTDNSGAVEMDVIMKDITNHNNSIIDRNLIEAKNDIISQQVSCTKSDENDSKCNKEMDIVMEDINNPHIALDCFIFL